VEDRLSIGLLHLDIAHGQTGKNRGSLVTWVEKAARAGARLVVTPELAVSGYSFESFDEVASLAESLEDETVRLLCETARRWEVTLCFGFAERDPTTNILYNSACVVGPDGRLAAHHRKNVTDRRWACPGTPTQQNLFDTPWGRVGLLICADTYYGLLPRSLALQGADLLLVPANWPPSGMDPRKIWRARALENGLGIIACNRTGVDRHMDCLSCSSYAVTAEGEVLLDGISGSSRLWMVDYPLENGRLASRHRKAAMARRRPEDYRALYLDVNGMEDFTGFWRLPRGGELEIRCVVPEKPEQTLAALEAAVCRALPISTLFVLPWNPPALPGDALQRLVQGRNLAIAAPVAGVEGTEPSITLIAPSGPVVLPPNAASVKTDFGPSRMALARLDALRHPELATALSKQGCDFVVTGTGTLTPDDLLLLGVKTIERTAVVATGTNGAAVFEPPVGHAPWGETLLHGPGTCIARFHTGSFRNKRFHDRVDMELLLRR